jgi:hypothetical protein
MATIINADTSNGLKLTSDTSGIIELQSGGTTKATVNSSGLTSSGHILQVLQSVKTDTFSTTSQTLVDVSDLSVAITPSSTSSKILVHMDLMVAVSFHVGGLQLVRDTTNIYQGDAAGNRTRFTIAIGIPPNSDGYNQRSSAMFLDSPSTTSATTYKIQAINRVDTSGGTMYINRTEQDRNTIGYDPRGVSSITVMEVAG